MKIIFYLIMIGFFLENGAWAQTTNQPASGLSLAQDLSVNGQHEAAALEYRRLALHESEAAMRGGYYWASAYEYVQSQRFSVAPPLLDRAENDAPELGPAALLLRGEIASAEKKSDEACFYWQSVLENAPSADMQIYARRRIAGEYIKQGQISPARAVLQLAPHDAASALAALERYERGRDKSPLLGGLLGMIPGLGYVYSGEYANGLRCLILNSLFIAAMVYSGTEDQWGAFAVISFFEITWYSGSIYGGLDAAHRHNRGRQTQCLEAVQGNARFVPDFKQLPVVTLQFRF